MYTITLFYEAEEVWFSSVAYPLAEIPAIIEARQLDPEAAAFDEIQLLEGGRS